MLWNVLPLEFHDVYGCAPLSSSFSLLPVGHCTCITGSGVLLLLPIAGKFGKGFVDEGEVGSAVLDATLGKAPVGRDERLCIGIAEYHLPVGK
jgi:hypothetical protein